MRDFQPAATTPIERRGRFWFKRDDLFVVNGASGGKARATYVMAHGSEGIVGVGARFSAQIARVALVAEYLGIPARVHTAASTDPSVPVITARLHGAEVIEHRPGYLSVCRARARADAASRPGWRLIPWGAISDVASMLVQDQCVGLPPARRIVLPVGSGITASGALRALVGQDEAPRLLGVVVGADPERTLAAHAPLGWQSYIDLVRSPLAYDQPAPVTEIEGIALDPIYEAKCLPYLEEDDLLWIVGGPIA